MNRPIGIFDSGVGGLTIVKEVIKQLPKESIVYFGDTARLPYGSKSKEDITKFSSQIIKFLLEQNVKLIIVACNTINANCIYELRNMFPHVDIIGVVDAGTKMASNVTINGRIGIIGTQATIISNMYEQLLKKNNSNFKIYSKACPLFVPLVEDGWINHLATHLITEHYLDALLQKNIDTLILGCTHYPMLAEVIQEVVGDVMLINPAIEVAKSTKTVLQNLNLESQKNATYSFYVSAQPSNMKKTVETFLGCSIDKVSTVEIDKYYL
ncbi:glutamate racemase [Candidatus Epulonipiscium fishelsonii]|uniref:Glutamate racemase n=1 Tax=Candidatus Epulonipiscium fishelsonii TaxID=77094 RepID=A0ACC8XDG8_9FIRM|nr:glutamate racemase [Epulopiscium sp. SCG-B05WGA-EpuloA1]ONI40812.1 glutamate racemase [Epulopiscium sp. SCG-B11WGA-EpuloA1]